MSSSEFENTQPSVEEIFRTSIKSMSSEDAPSYEYDIEPEESLKKKLYKEGLYDPGSGDICAAYIPLSQSSVLRHEYYNYPGLQDPGIVDALLFLDENKVYDDDGQELYMDLCKQMKIIPVRCFHRALKENYINLRYYGVNPVGVRAICLALACNKTVKRLDLTSNFLENEDACYHLGQMLGDRNAIQQLVLAGCNIGPKGVRRLVVYLHNRKLDLLDLSGNNIEDLGFTYLADEIQSRAVIKKLNLSRNHLTSESALLFAEVIEFNDTTTHLDLSWNEFFEQKGQAALIRQLGQSKVLVEINLAWTSFFVAAELRSLLGIPTLRVLNLSNNKLGRQAARTIARNLHLAMKLKTLDLSSNPFSPYDAFQLLGRMKQAKVKVRELRMDHIVVSKEFAEDLQEIMQLRFRKNTIITHGEVLGNYEIPLSDLKTITLKSLLRSMKKKRRNKLDILSYFLELKKTRTHLEQPELMRTFKIYDIRVSESLIEGIVKVFPGPRNDSGKRSINLVGIVEYIHRLWPEKEPPPTPPPTPPPEPLPKVKKMNKGKKKKGK